MAASSGGGKSASTGHEFTVVAPERFGIGECPTWNADAGELLWTSIDDGDIHALHVDTGRRRKWHFDSTVGSFGLCRSGCLVVALKDEIVVFDPRSGDTRRLASTPLPIAEARLNDGKVGPDGAFWVGAMDVRPNREPIASLYRIDPNGGVRVVASGLQISNGLAWSPDGRILYHADSRGPWVDQWDFDPSAGAASNRRRLLNLDEAIGRPDGAAIDVEGNYWCAGPSASCVNRFSPGGQLLETIRMPNFRPTMPCFGGADMKTLFVTSLSGGVPEEVIEANPLCGKVLSVRLDVAGTQPYRFAD